MSSVLGSLAGFGGWLVAARLMPQAEVGVAAAFVSGFILIASAAQLHIGVALLSWLPPAGRRQRLVLFRTVAVVGPLALMVGLLYAMLAPSLGETAAKVFRVPLPVGIAIFAIAAAGWCLFVLQDYVLVGLGRAWWTTIRNGGFAMVRIALLVTLSMAGAGAGAMVVSWIAPIVVWVLVTGAVIAVLVARKSATAGAGRLPGRAEVVGFVGPTAVAHLGVALLFNQVPLLVTLRWGPEPGAAFFVAWQAIIVVDTAAVFFTNPLSAQVARDPDRTTQLCSAARRRLLVVFLPALAIGALIARPALSVFGPGYAQAAGVLQLLLLGLAFRLVVLGELAALQAVGRAITYSALQLGSTLLVLVPAALLPVRTGDVDHVLAPVAFGYIAVQAIGAAAAVLPPLRRGKRQPPGRHRAPDRTGLARPAPVAPERPVALEPRP